MSTEKASQHPFREYLHEFRDNWKTVREDLGDAWSSARYLWPLVWRATLDAESERAEQRSERLAQAIALEFAWSEARADDELKRRGLPGLRELGIWEDQSSEERPLHLV